MRCRLTRRYDAARLDAGISRLEPSLWCAAMRMHENRHLEPEARNLVVLPGMQGKISRSIGNYRMEFACIATGLIEQPGSTHGARRSLLPGAASDDRPQRDNAAYHQREHRRFRHRGENDAEIVRERPG